MFTIECFIYLLIVVYSIIYQTRVIVGYNKNKKIILKDASGLYVSKDILNKNNLGTLYVTKIDGKHNDHYDVERNVIRLSKEVYDESNLASLAVSFNQSIKALVYSKNKKRKEEKIKCMILDYSNKISFFLFLLGVSSKAIDLMTLALIIMIIDIVVKYYNLNQKQEVLSNNINYLKKIYKLSKSNAEKLEKYMNVLLLNELSLKIFNNKY